MTNEAAEPMTTNQPAPAETFDPIQWDATERLASALAGGEWRNVPMRECYREQARVLLPQLQLRPPQIAPERDATARAEDDAAFLQRMHEHPPVNALSPRELADVDRLIVIARRGAQADAEPAVAELVRLVAEECGGLPGDVCADDPDDEPVWEGRDGDDKPTKSKITFGHIRRAHAHISAAPPPQSPAPDDGWRDIASAPKDGTQFDAWIVPPDWSVVHKGPFRATNVAYLNEDGEFWLRDILGNITDWKEDGKQRATHWRPLPPTPQSAGAATPAVASSGSEDDGAVTRDPNTWPDNQPARAASAPSCAGEVSAAEWQAAEAAYFEPGGDLRTAVVAASRVRADSVAEAVAAERERCALLAEQHSGCFDLATIEGVFVIRG